MKAALLLCVLVATALAAPRYKRATKLDPSVSAEVRAAESAWAAAEKEPDHAKAATLWQAAAVAFAAIDATTLDVSVKREAAYAEVLAWKNALDITVGTLSRQPLGAAIDRYLKYADASDPEMPQLLFLKARALPEDQLDAAIQIYRTIVKRYPRSEVAEYAANLALDGYNRRAEYELMVAFANELANDPSFLRDRDDLASTVKKIQRRAAQIQAENIERAAREAHDLEHFTAAGQAYLDIYNTNPKAIDGDETLYNAAVSFEEGRSIASAIKTFELLRKQYPKSKIAAHATARLGMLYANAAMYERAAELLEEYAKKYTTEKDAHAALSDAVFYRKGTGNRAKAIEDTRFFVKAYGSKKPREAADAMWSLSALYDGDEAIKHLHDYLKLFGAKGGVGRVVIAHAKIGQLLLKQSCSVRGVDGLCATVNETPRTCGKGMTTTFAVTARNKTKVKEARGELEQAIREYERNPVTDDVEARYYAAQARLALADLELEPYLSLAFPRALDFDATNSAVRTDSTKRFSDWLEQRQKAGAALSRRYESVLATKDIASSITASARLAIVAQSFAATMSTAQIPRDIASGPLARDKRDAYCDKMLEVAEPLAERSVMAFAVCLQKSTELSWFSDSSRLCESELARMKPEEFPLAPEVRSEAAYYAPVIALEPATLGK